VFARLSACSKEENSEHANECASGAVSQTCAARSYDNSCLKTGGAPDRKSLFKLCSDKTSVLLRKYKQRGCKVDMGAAQIVRSAVTSAVDEAVNILGVRLR
jgi:hypothetical protein